MDDEESEWYDSFGESYDDDPPGAPGASEPDSDSWKTSTVGKPGRPAAPEQPGAKSLTEEEEEDQQALHTLMERLRSKEQLLELEATARRHVENKPDTTSAAIRLIGRGWPKLRTAWPTS